MLRKLLAGILGGLAFFAWSSIIHLGTSIAETGFQEIPNEGAVLSAMKANIPNQGLYFFPGTGIANPTHSQRMAAMQQKATQHYVGPGGILVYHPAQSFDLNMRQLLTEFATNVVQVLLVVFLLGQTRLATFAARWRFATVAGVLAAITTNVSYWNFYGFPGNYTLAYGCVVAMGFVCAGLVVAAMIKPGAGMPAANAATA